MSGEFLGVFSFLRMLYQISRKEVEELIASGIAIGVQRALESVCERPRYISQNKAYKRFRKARVQQWVERGLVKPMPNGKGKTSTVNYELAQLLEAEACETIIIYKS